MLKDRRQIFALGELVLFLGAWMLGMLATVDNYRHRSHPAARDNVASSTSFPGADFSGHRDLLE